MKKIIIAIAMSAMLSPAFSIAQNTNDNVDIVIKNQTKYFVKGTCGDCYCFKFFEPFSEKVVNFKANSDSTKPKTLDLYSQGMADEPLGHCKVTVNFTNHQPLVQLENIDPNANYHFSCKLKGNYVVIFPRT